MSWRRLRTLLLREVRATLRDWFTLSVLVFVPLGSLLALICALHVLWTLLRLAGMPWAPQVQARTLRFTALAALGANWVFLVCH